MLCWTPYFVTRELVIIVKVIDIIDCFVFSVCFHFMLDALLRHRELVIIVKVIDIIVVDLC